MILSMTGFGAAERHLDGVSYRVEIRSLNGRYFKLALKLPDALTAFEPIIERRLRNRVGRGSITYTLAFRDESPGAAQEINIGALRSYVDQLLKADVSAAGARIDLAGLVALPGVCQPREMDENALRTFQTTVEHLTDEAADRLIEMRRAEGASLQRDLLDHCEKIGRIAAVIRQRCPAVVEDYHQRLRARVNALLASGELKLKEDDLIREVAIFAERCDISEELSRLDGHLEHFAALSRGDEEAGRKLEFLSQEMLREANTIGSKASDSAISRQVVEIKALIDRIKEQVQNVE